MYPFIYRRSVNKKKKIFVASGIGPVEVGCVGSRAFKLVQVSLTNILNFCNGVINMVLIK